MNDRIKELLYEAGGQYGGEHFITGQTIIYTDEVDYEKFAELIIRECANLVPKIWSANPLVVSTRIKERFGVEE